MKIISSLLLSSAICVTFSFAGVITGVSVIVNDEPITLYEVNKYSEKLKISKDRTIQLLIKEKLELSEIKKFGISTDSFELDKAITNMATKNGLNQYEFLNMLKSKNIEPKEYKKDLAKQINKDKLYKKIYRDKLKSVEISEIKEFYQKNINNFEMANSFDIIVYSAQNPNSLKAIQKNPMLRPEGVKVENKTLSANSIDKNLKGLLNSTKNGKFTRIIKMPQSMTMFYMQTKNEVTTLPFEEVKDKIYGLLSKQKEEKVLKEYFDKLKSSASIKVLRN